MARFSVFSGEVLVGYSMLEFGDPPMGVAFGRFEPAAAYAAIKQECATSVDQTRLALSVRTETGFAIPCVGVGILDSPMELVPSEAEVTVLGIPYSVYNDLFPEHVAAYERRFNGDNGGTS